MKKKFFYSSPDSKTIVIQSSAPLLQRSGDDGGMDEGGEV